MSTVGYQPTQEVIVMSKQTTPLRPDLQEVVADILALRALTRKDHFITHKTQRDILNRLNQDDLTVVARALAAEEAKQQPIYTKK
jgi:hypothetical protein